MGVARIDIAWHAGLRLTRTRKNAIFTVAGSRPDLLHNLNHNAKVYRNPIIFAKELQDEMLRDNLTRKQLARLHGVSSERITQWLCLLKLPEETQTEIKALGDHWNRQIISERKLRKLRE